MKKYSTTVFALLLGSVVLSTFTEPGYPAPEKKASSLVEVVKQGKTGLFTVPFARYAAETRELPIGVFDSGIAPFSDPFEEARAAKVA